MSQTVTFEQLQLDIDTETIIMNDQGEPQFVVIPVAEYQNYLTYKKWFSLGQEKNNIIDEHIARRKANHWLIEYVGNMVMADKATLIQQEKQFIWRFEAYITAKSHAPKGPIGHVEINALTATPLTNLRQAEEMRQYGTAVEFTISSPTN